MTLGLWGSVGIGVRGWALKWALGSYGEEPRESIWETNSSTYFA